MTSNAVQNLQIEVNTDYQGAIRFPAWFALSVFSIVCLVASTSEVSSESRGSEERWTITVAAISMCVSMAATCAYLFVRQLIMGSPLVEGVMTLVLLTFWGIGLPVIMGPDNAIAVAGSQVVNANLYFFTWVSFTVCILLTLSLLQETMGVDARQADGKQARWFFLFASSLVVMGSATRIFVSSVSACDSDLYSGSKFCKRSKFAISLGVISCMAALAMTLSIFKHMSAAIVELGVSSVLLILWTFGVGFITFGGSSSPGTSIGNLYFSTWISFIITVMIFGKSFQETLGMQQSQSSSTQSTTTEGNDNDPGSSTPPTLPNEEDL